MHRTGEEESDLGDSDLDDDSEGSDASSYPITTEVACSNQCRSNTKSWTGIAHAYSTYHIRDKLSIQLIFCPH